MMTLIDEFVGLSILNSDTVMDTAELPNTTQQHPHSIHPFLSTTIPPTLLYYPGFLSYLLARCSIPYILLLTAY